MWNLLVGPAISAVSGYFRDRAAIKQAEVEGKIEIMKQASKNVAEWEMLHAQGSQSSWKDEYVLIMLSIPTIMAFIPALNTFAVMGFEVMHTLPEWYRYLFVTVCLASYGIKMKDVFFNK